MKNKLQIGTNEMFNAPLLFYIICASQVGVGVHGFQAVIYQNAKHDAWISIIISFLAAYLSVFMSLKLLKMYETEDILASISIYSANILGILLIYFWSYIAA